MKTIAGIIHARKQSTRCPNKHLRPLGNTTLIDIALDKLSKLDLDEKYLRYKLGLISRDEYLARPVEKTIQDIYNIYSNAELSSKKVIKYYTSKLTPFCKKYGSIITCERQELYGSELSNIYVPHFNLLVANHDQKILWKLILVYLEELLSINYFF